MKLTQEILTSLLSYDKDTGLLFWKKRTPGCFMQATACPSWNAKYAGKPAGSVHTGRSGRYIRIDIMRRTYLAHRIIWMIMTGSWPSEEIDHIDRNGTNNKWSNLRDVSKSQNLINRDFKSECRGVRVKGGRYEARLTRGGKQFYLGRHKTMNDARHAIDQFIGITDNQA